MTATVSSAYLLTLAEHTTRFRDHLATLQFSEPNAPARAQGLAEHASSLRAATEAMSA